MSYHQPYDDSANDADPSTDKGDLLRNLGDKRSCVEAVTSGHKAATIEQRTRDEEAEKRNLVDQRGKDDESRLSSDICRICHMGSFSATDENRASRERQTQPIRRVDSQTSTLSSYAYLGPLISACKCRGTVALVHAECLERWLTESGHSRCELCGYKYATKRVPRHNLFRSVAIWFNTVIVTRQMLLDILYLIVTTPLALFSCYICILALRMLLKRGLQEMPWMVVAMLPTCSLTLIAYWGWIITLARKAVYRGGTRAYLLLEQKLHLSLQIRDMTEVLKYIENSTLILSIDCTRSQIIFWKKIEKFNYAKYLYSTHQKHAPEQASDHEEKKEETEGKTESGREITSKRKKTIGNDSWTLAQKFSKLIFLRSWLKNVKKCNRKTYPQHISKQYRVQTSQFVKPAKKEEEKEHGEEEEEGESFALTAIPDNRTSSTDYLFIPWDISADYKDKFNTLGHLFINTVAKGLCISVLCTFASQEPNRSTSFLINFIALVYDSQETRLKE
ncbi:E3 ubiquitin-protein ligase MARCH3 [Melipona quadrifasciata]|uniref:E3 ubiquitin-protein ligase MARCH3 n=1 Tax=Melipona quadrifasciata TaxID=166423 RepID=A0A0M8ZXG8_9HYME|nr:E3 ubiquitin-protein ligase MARCH3 [Melipona quadrifasciata]